MDFVSLLQLAKQHKCQFFETSAWKNINITEAFTALTEQILNSVSILASAHSLCLFQSLTLNIIAPCIHAEK